MAGSEYTIKVQATGGQSIESIKKGLEGLGLTVSRTRTRVSDANKGQQDFFDTQKKGIIGTANSTKSFSKLAETIGSGGSSGLVGAYATLAANTFAVVAAFGALRGAAQVEQIFRGLEAAGTRTGRSLVGTAKALKEVTGNAIDTEQAMRSTAQIVSGGFDDKTVKRLGQAARDTSFALGRNMSDSLDRLTRGVVKLEPELLDELGIMTKLTESNTNYARTLGKSESNLTSFEKRQGFANAVLSEAELKFGGLSAAAGDATAYDKLSSQFKNLNVQLFNFLNFLGKPIAGILASSTTALLGTVILFASTLKKQLLPGLANSVTRTNLAAKAAREYSIVQFDAAKAEKKLAETRRATDLTNKASFNFIGDRGIRVYREHREELLRTIGTTENLTKAQAKAMNSLSAGIRANRGILRDNPNFAKGTVQGDEKRSEQAGFLREQRAVLLLQRTRTAAASTSIDEDNKVVAARRQAASARQSAVSSEAAASTVGAASQLKLKDAWTSLTRSVRTYAQSQALANVAGTSSLGVAGGLRVGLFALSLSFKAVGTAILTVLPYLGLIVVAFGLLKSAYEGLKSDATKKLEKSIESLGEVTNKANDYGKELARINLSQASASLRAAQAITIQGNATQEATEKFSDYAANFRDQNNTKSWFDKLFGGDTTSDEVASFWESLGTRSALSYSYGLKKNSKALDLAEVLQQKFLGFTRLGEGPKQAVALFNTLEQANSKGLKKVLDANGGFEKFASTLKGMSDLQIVNTFDKLGKEVDNLTTKEATLTSFKEAFKNLENTLNDFTRSSIPTTPFDELVKSFVSAGKAATELKKSVNDPKFFSELLSGLGAGTVRALNIDTQLDIQEYNKADAIVQSILAKRAQLKGTGETLSATDRLDLRVAQRTLEANKDLGDRITEQVAAKTKLVQQAQESARIAKSELTILNAQLEASTALFQNGAAGLKARYEAEDRIRKNQVESLKIVIKTNEGLLGNNNAVIAGIEAEKLRIETQITYLGTLNEERHLRAKMFREQDDHMLAARNIDPSTALASTANGANLPTSSRGRSRVLNADEIINNRMMNAYRKIYDIENSTLDVTGEITKLHDKQKGLDAQIVDFKAQNRDIMQGNLALQNEMNALELQSLDPLVRAAKLREAQRNYYAGAVSTLDSQLKSAGELSNIYDSIDAQLAGVSDRLDYQLYVIHKTAQQNREEAERARDVELGTRRSNLEVAQAELIAARKRSTGSDIEAAKTGVTFAQNALDISQHTYDLAVAKIGADEKLATLAKTYIDAADEGLKIQENSLNTLSQILSAEKELSDAEQKRLEVRTKLYAKRNGFETSPTGEQALEIRAAQKAYEFAVSEAGIKKSLIDLQYALLAAQRDNLTYELRAKQTAYKATSTEYQQLESVLNRIGNVDFDAAATSAKKAIDIGISNSFDELQLARTTRTADGPFAKGFASIIGLLERNRAISDTNSTKLKIPDAEKTVREKASAEKVDFSKLSSGNPLVDVNNKLITSIVNLKTTIDNWLQSNPLMSVATEGTDYGQSASSSTSGNAKIAMDFFLKKGMTAAQAAGITGNLQVESYGRIDPTAKNGNMRGIAQWDTKRQANFKRLYGEELETAGLMKQLNFLYHEITVDAAESASLKRTGFWDKSNNATQSATKFEAGFERSGGDNLTSRVGNANKLVVTAVAPIAAAAEVAGQALVKGATAAAAKLATVREANPNTSPAFSEAPVTAVAANDNSRMAPGMITVGAPEAINSPDANLISSSAGFLESLNNAKAAKPGIDEIRGAMQALLDITESTREALKSLGPQGEVVTAISEGSVAIGNSFLNVGEAFKNSQQNIALLQESVDKGGKGMTESAAKAADFAGKFTAIASVASAALSMIQSATAASAKAKEDAIDREIAAEQKKDGKSAESLAKIASLEKKKDEIARKQFNLKKKMMMAQAVIATAAAVVQALTLGPIIGPIMAGIIGAMGLAQIAIIAGTQYQSAASTTATAAMPSTLTIGKRGDTVDLGKQNNNVGGELGYLRGAKGQGNNSSNYSVIGSAYGGDMPRGYGNTAYVVGEKGPETISPMTPMTVRPANDNASSNSPMNATINIHALDASGVEDILHNQKGNIIRMLREASNANGKPFMEDVNTNIYSRPNTSSRL